MRNVDAIKENEDEAEWGSSDVLKIASGSPGDHESGERDDYDLAITDDTLIIDYIYVKAIPTKVLTSGKELLTPEIFKNIDAEDLTTVGRAP